MPRRHFVRFFIGLTFRSTVALLVILNACCIELHAQVLDALPPAQAAYSLRKIRTAHTMVSPAYPVVAGSSYVPTNVTGPAVRVRRTSDDALQDIGFTGSGDLDQAALLDFIGGPNYFTYSEQFNNAAIWSGVGVTITTNSVQAPNTSTTAEVLAEGTGNNEHFIDYNYTTPLPSRNYSMSVYVKPINTAGRIFILRGVFADGTSSSYISFDLNSGTVLGVTGGRWTNTAILPAANGWYQLRGTYSTPATITPSIDLVFRMQFMESNPLANVYVGNTAVSVALWGAQLQPGTVFLGYTPTNTNPQLVIPSGYIHTWFDQTGNNRHVMQVNQDNQPVLVDTGIIYKNSLARPTVKFYGNRTYTGSSFLGMPSSSINATNSSLNMVVRWLSLTGSTNSDIPFGIGTSNDTRRGRFFYRSPNTNVGWSCWAGDVTTTGLTPDTIGSIHTWNAHQNGTSLIMAKDGAESAFTIPTSPLTPSTGIGIGQLNNPTQTGNFFTEMEFSEGIVFASTLSLPERRILQCDQGTYYGSPTTISGLDFYIAADVDPAGCKTATEQVLWNSATIANATVSSNSMQKISTFSWDGGGASMNTVKNGGYLQFIATETNKARMAGLSTAFGGVNYPNIQFAIYLRSDAIVGIYESGNNRGTFGTYSANDVFRIAVEAGIIKYYKNGVQFYVSSIVPVLPLLVHTSLYDVGATVTQAVVVHPFSGNFTANAANSGPNPVYQWKVNGINVGTNANTYSNTGLAYNDQVTCQITLNGCVSNAVTSNTITIGAVAPNPSLAFYIQGVADTSACKSLSEPVIWRFVNLDNISKVSTATGTISKTAGSGWDAAGISYTTVSNNGYLQFTAPQSNKAIMGGLSNTYTGVSYTNVQYAIYLAANGSLQVYESGNYRNTFGSYSTGDVFKIAVESGRINYYRNDVLFYTSTVLPTLPLLVNVSIADIGAALTSMTVVNRHSGSFTATVLNGTPSPNFTWKVNGTTVQSGTSNTYSNAALNVNDAVSCTMQLTGCLSSNTYTSTSLTTLAATPSPAVTFYISAIPDQSACRKTGEQVVWMFTNLSNYDRLITTGNNATKRLTNGWDAAAISYNQVVNNGYLEFKAIETNKSRMVGLSSSYTGSSYTNLQYAIYLQSNATVGIYESGNNRGNFGSYAANDVFRVAVDNNSIRYYKNGTVFYTSTVVPVLPLLAHTALNDIGSSAADLWVWNPGNGNFTAVALNTYSPLNYTWNVNGVATGNTSSTYSNPNLVNGDQITCTLRFATCYANSYPSNQIVIAAQAPNPSLAYYIQGTPDSSACQLAGEQVVWSFTTLTDQQRLQINGSTITKLVSTGWDAGSASYNTVVEGGYLEFRIAEVNKARMIGLSSTYASSSYTTILYAIYLQNNGGLGVYESGTNRGTFGSYAATDTFRIAIEQGKVFYYRNGTMFYASGTLPTLPLLVNASFNDPGATVLDPVVWNLNSGRFNAVVINGTLPVNYQWKVNGTAAGTNSQTFTIATLTTNDLVTCDLQLAGCLNTVVASNTIRRRAVVPNPSLAFVITGDVDQNSCRMAGEEVVWKFFTSFQDQARIVRNGNNLSKILSTGWDGGAASYNLVNNNGYMEFTASETNKSRMLGLSTAYTTSSYTGIQFAFYLQSNGALGVYESGNNRGNFGTYATGDKLRIQIQVGTVKYYRNGTLVYTSTVTPSLPLLVNASLNDIGATLTNVMVFNYNNGVFYASSYQSWYKPVYTWMVNGVIKQSTTSYIYRNNALNPNDTITCRLELAGCLNGNNYISNKIIIVSAPQQTTDFFIEGIAVAPGCNMAIEQVKWSNSDQINIVNVVNVNSLVKTAGNGVWNGGAASLNTVKDRGYFEFTATENNRLRAAGLSTVNNGSDQNTIYFCFYLQNDGNYRIYENGLDRGLMGTYQPGSVFRITVENRTVKYLKDGVVVYISANVPTLPMMVDISINEAGGTITNALVANYNNGSFWSNIPNAGIYNWMVNGVTLQNTAQNTFTPASIRNGDTVTCILNSNLPGCQPQVLVSNYIVYKSVPTDSTDFYISGVATNGTCNFVTEQVKWKLSERSNGTMLLLPDNSLIKLQNNNLWTGGAASWNKVYNYGYFEFTATETTKNKAIGLTNGYPGSNLATIQFAILLQNTATFRVYESNNDRGGFGTFAQGDVFRITVDNNVVKYFKNGVVFYISGVTPVLPLVADVSINEVGGTVGRAIICNYTNGTYLATQVFAGTNPTYVWMVNNITVQSGTSASFAGTGVLPGDTIRCTMTSDVNGCSPYPFYSNYIVAGTEEPGGVDYAITSNPATATCAMVTEPVRWKLSELSREAQIINGNSLTRLQNSGWNCGAFSWNKVYNNGYLEFGVNETTKARMIGLSSTNVNADWNTIQYAIYLTSSGSFDIRQSGATIAVAGNTYTSADVFRIAVESNVVRYYRNGILLYSSLITPTLPLMADVSMYDAQSTVKNAVITNYSNGTFNAFAVNAGSAPIYTWKVNGSIRQTGVSASYTDLGLLNSDTLTCVLTSSQPGCSVEQTLSNAIITTITAQTNVDFAIHGIAVATSCAKVREKVSWKKQDLTPNVTAVNGNGLSKSAGSPAWDGGAASWNTVSNNGYLEFIAQETNKARMIGLSSTNAGSDQNSIRYGILLDNGGIYRIYELGTYKGFSASYLTGDTFSISVDANVVKYMKGSTTVYVSALVPTLPLIADVSIYDGGGTVSEAVTVNYNAGAFEALSLNPGNTPLYEWSVNGAVVQSGSSSNYTNGGLANNDLVTCRLTANLAGCIANAPLSSNEVRNIIKNPDNVDAYVKGIPAPTACALLYEEVKWKSSDLTNLSAAGNDLVKIQSDGVWDGGAASWNTAGLNGGFFFIITENNKARMAGLSATNTSNNAISIGFAFNLLATGELRISESGTDRGYSGAYLPGDILRLTIESVAGQNRVRYYRNNVLVYTSTVTLTTLPLLADVSIFNQGGTITDAIIYNPHAGGFTAGATNAGTPNYEWKLNGVTVQNSTSSTYTNAALADNDVVTCIITPGLTGCNAFSFASNITTEKIATVRITNPAPLCSPQTADLTIPSITSGTATDMTLSYWSDAAATVPVTNPRSVGSGTYYIKGTRLNNCSDIRPVTVLIRNSPTGSVTSAGNELTCNTTSVQLSASGSAPLMWDNQSTSASRTVTQAGTYVVTFTDAFNCSTRINHVIFQNTEPPLVSILGNTSPICQGASVTLQAQPSTFNNALRLDGNSQSADLGNWFNYRNFTVEMWLKPAALQSPYATIIDNNYYFTGISWTCAQNNAVTNQYQFICYSATGSQSINFNLTANAWQHVALVKSATALTAYVNGVQVATAPWTLGPIQYDGTEFLRLGRWGGGTRFWSGQYDEVRVFNNDLPATQIATDMNTNYPTNTANLLAYYKMDQPDNSPTVINSTLSGFGTGPVIGNPNFIPSGVTVNNAFTYAWNPGGATTNTVSTVPTGPVTYYTTVSGTNGCPRIESTELTVSLSGLAAVTSTPSACQDSSSTPITFTATGASPPYTFYYQMNGVNQTITTSASSNVATLNFPNSSPGTYTVALQNLTYSNASFCLQAQTGNAALTIHPAPSLQVTNPPAVCAPGTADLTLSTVTAGSQAGSAYTYYTNATAATPLTNPSAISASGTYYIKCTEPTHGCSTMRPVNVTINPQVSMVPLADDTICSGSAATLSLAATSASTFSWATSGLSSGLSGASGGTGNTIQQTINSATGSNGSFDYVITPTAVTSGCPGIPDTVHVVVNANAQLISTAGGKGCGTSSVQLNATSNVGTVMWFTGPSGGSAIGTGSPFNTPAISATTTYYAQAFNGRCSSGQRDPVIATIENPGQWLGYTIDWDTPTNWGCSQVPTSSTDVQIPTVPIGGHFPTVSSNLISVCRKLTIDPSASVTVLATADLGIYGDLIDNGNPSLGNGTLRFNSSLLQLISGPQTLTAGGVVMNNSKTGNAVRLMTDFIVTNSIAFNSGIIDLNGKTLTLGTTLANGSLSGAMSGRHINSLSGYFVRYTTTAQVYLFPLGDSVRYTPITLDFHAGPLSGASIQSKVSPGKQPNLLSSIYLNRYWSMTPSGFTQGYSYDAHYTYSSAAEIIGSGILYPVKYSTATGVPVWSSCPGSGVASLDGTSGAHNAAALTFDWLNLTGFSDFTGANTAQPLPVELHYFNAKAIDKEVKCEWVTLTEINNDRFDVERSRDGVTFESIGQVQGAGTITTARHYEFIDPYPFPGLNYYRLRQTDFDGQSVTSEVELVVFDKSNELILTLYPSEGQLHVAFNREILVERIELYDVSGRKISSYGINHTLFNTAVPVDGLAAGIYLIKVNSEDGIYSEKFILNNR